MMDESEFKVLLRIARSLEVIASVLEKLSLPTMQMNFPPIDQGYYRRGNDEACTCNTTVPCKVAGHFK